jgi:hypothetical protein
MKWTASPHVSDEDYLSSWSPARAGLPGITMPHSINVKNLCVMLDIVALTSNLRQENGKKKDLQLKTTCEKTSCSNQYDP